MQEPATDAIREVEIQLATLFSEGRRFISQVAKRVHPDLQPSGLFLLRLLEASGPSRPSTIAEHLEVDRSAISRIIHALDTLGLIERTPDPNDKRAQMLSLTAEGRKCLGLIESDVVGPVRQALQEWDEEDVVTFGRLLNRFNTRTGE